MDAEPRLRDYAGTDAAWVLRAHARHYARVEGFDARFRPLVAAALRDVAGEMAAGRAAGWIAEAGDGRRAGCIFLWEDGPGQSRLRLFYVAAPWRGTGLGRRLLATALGAARARGHRAVRVATYDRHARAGRLYGAAGFALERARPVTAFGQDMVEQHWKIALAPG